LVRQVVTTHVYRDGSVVFPELPELVFAHITELREAVQEQDHLVALALADVVNFQAVDFSVFVAPHGCLPRCTGSGELADVSGKERQMKSSASWQLTVQSQPGHVPLTNDLIDQIGDLVVD